MSNTPPMGWASRMANYAAQNGGARVKLTPAQFRRWNKKHRAQVRRAHGGVFTAAGPAHAGDGHA